MPKNIYDTQLKNLNRALFAFQNILNIQVQLMTVTCYQHAWYYRPTCGFMLSLCAVELHRRHAGDHRTDDLLQDYGYNMLREMWFVGNSREDCTRHAQLMITSSTLTASQQSLLNCQCDQLGNA